MELGVFLLAGQFPGMTHARAHGGAVDYAVAAERAGLTSAWVAEHHFISYGVCPSAIALAAHLLGRTTRLRIGTAIFMLANRHPVALAEETALLDHLGDGRFHLGVGRGGPWVDLEVFATGLDRYQHGLAESLDLLLAWLERDRVGTHGPRFRFREVAVVPRPATRPRPPVVVAATSPATVEVAAARGLPLLLGLHSGDDDKVAFLHRWRQTAERHGHDPDTARHLTAAVAQVADTTADAQASLRAAMPPWLERGIGDYVSIAQGTRPRHDPRAYVEYLLQIHPVGTPERCAERLATSAERTGIRRFLLMVEGSGDHGRTLDNIARLGTEVAPRLGKPPSPMVHGTAAQ
jgi:alkanesulfonate monooxygenase SsuD/methylene tetrahydromethanopterin reductase-like flavin-dependent oxidoreductase (luciferase family)